MLYCKKGHLRSVSHCTHGSTTFVASLLTALTMTGEVEVVAANFSQPHSFYGFFHIDAGGAEIGEDFNLTGADNAF